MFYTDHINQREHIYIIFSGLHVNKLHVILLEILVQCCFCTLLNFIRENTKERK